MGTSEPMSATEARSIRSRLGLTERELAYQLNLTPAIVEGFEAGDVRIPKREARVLRYLLAVHERQEALDGSGLPRCAWVTAWESQPPTKSLDDETKRLEALNTHADACATCIAREQFLLTRFGPMPRAPFHGWLRVVGPIIERVDRLPAWAQPPAKMALAFLAYTLLRGLLQSPRLLNDASAAGSFLLAIPLTLGLGAAVGFLITGWRLARGRLRKKTNAAPST